MTGPVHTIGRECFVCMGRVRCLDERERCQSKECPLWPYRLGHKPQGADVSPLKAIRLHCLDCAGSPTEVKNCTGKLLNGDTCHLHPYRFGRNPNLAGKGQSADVMRGVREALAHGREEPQKRTKKPNPVQPTSHSPIGLSAS